MDFGFPSSQKSSNKEGLVTSTIPTNYDNEADVLNDETFGDCDLEAIKIKSDFGENGEFLGDSLPDFFQTDQIDKDGGGFFSLDPNDQSQQPSIDALLGEDIIRIPTNSLGLGPTATINSLFNTAISQAGEGNSGNPFSQTPMSMQRLSPLTLPNQMMAPPVQPPNFHQQSTINYQLLAQVEQMLINRQVPSQERFLYIQRMLETMQRNAINAQQQNMARVNQNFNQNGHDQHREGNLNRMTMNNHQSHEGTRPMVIGELMQRAQLSAMNPQQNQSNVNRSQSPSIQNQSMSSQFMDAIQRFDQSPTVEHRQPESPSSPKEHMPSPPTHHQGQMRHNRQQKHYPRPPCLKTWQGRGSGYDEFAGMMNDREKQWVVKIQLQQVALPKEEDFYFQKWCERKTQAQQNNGTQLNRHDHRGQYIIYPVLQLLKSIQQEKELADRLSQNSTQATFSNVNPTVHLPYATPLNNQLGKQSTATPRHPRSILDLDGAFTIGRRTNAITHEKHELGVLLHIENIYRDLLRYENQKENLTTKVSIDSIADRFLNDQNYLFGELFTCSRKGQMIFQRICSHLSRETTSTEKFELILNRIYGSLLFMVECCATNFQIEPVVFPVISSIQQHVNIKSSRLDQIFTDFQEYYNEKVRPKLMKFRQNPPKRPFFDANLFNNSDSATILIEFLLTLERRCYLLPQSDSQEAGGKILQQLQNQIEYRLSEPVRDLINDICQSLIQCSTPKKLRRTLPQVQSPMFSLLSKFLQSQLTKQVYQMVEPKLISCCVKDA